MLKPIGGGQFKLEVDENNSYFYNNFSMEVTFQFKNEESVSLETNEIPVNVKMEIYNAMPIMIQEDMEMAGWLD